MIKLIVLDVDGCLSDGKLIYSNDGCESKNFNVKDGLGISTWNRIGNQTVIITGRKSEIVQVDKSLEKIMVIFSKSGFKNGVEKATGRFFSFANQLMNI